MSKPGRSNATTSKASYAATVAIALAAGAVSGAIGARFATPADPMQPAQLSSAAQAAQPDGALPASELEALERALQAEREARFELEDEVAMLKSVVDAMFALSARESEAPSPAGSGEEPALAEAPRNVSRSGRLPGFGGGGFDEARLLAVGIPPAEAEAIRARWEKMELDRLYLSNEAVREGWQMTPKHRESIQGLYAGLREELGEDGYDRMLYATNRPNRIVVRDVLGESQASRAGLQAGDQLLSYDGQRVFAPRELTRLTAEGERRESVRVVVRRDGSTQDFWLERGPIGVMLDRESQPPE